ncbi:MAG: ParB/RepB/Spo0J family partition protein [bacterium]|nr:ParB/RepB/Spo0J family partition protein [bacterium]
MPHHYVVRSVKASSPAQKSAGPDVIVSRTLEDFGFGPTDESGDRDEMNHRGATPREFNIVVRIGDEEKKWFILIRVEKDGKRPRLMQLETGTYFSDPVATPDGLLVINGHGKKLLDWEITFERRPILDGPLNSRGDLVYTEHEGSSHEHNGKTGKRERVLRGSIESRRTMFPSPPPEQPTDTPVYAPSESAPQQSRASTETVSEPPMVTAFKKKETASPSMVSAPQNGEPVCSPHPLATAEVPTAKEAPPVQTETITSRDRVAMVKTTDIVPDPHQPRKYFEEEGLHSTAESMKAESQVVPIIVRPVTISGVERYMIIDGECRWKSAKLVGVTELLVVIRLNVDDRKAFRQSVTANYNRRGHTVRESVDVIKRLLEDGATTKEVWTLCGMSTAWYYEHIALLKLEPELLKLVDPPTEKKSRLPVSIARKLAYMPLSEQLPAYHRLMCEPSKAARSALADELVRPYIGESRRNKPSDHMRSLERFVLRLRAGKRTLEQHVDVASRALVINRKPEQVEVILSTLEESIHELTNLKKIIETKRQELTAT